MNKTILFGLGVCAAIGAAGRVASAANIGDFIDYSLTSGGSVLLPGRLYVPPEASDAGAPRPLIVFLHGSGADGTNNINQISAVSDGLIGEAKSRGAFLYVPQTVDNWSSSAVIDRVMTMVDRAVAVEHADARRLYATGYSNGGGGVWNLLSRHPDRFAAAVAISGVAPAPGFRAANLMNTPLFVLHARDDMTVSIAVSRGVVNSILVAGRESLPSYPPLSSLANLFISNPALAAQQPLTSLVHQSLGATDFFLSDARHDLMYFDASRGGHSGLVGALGAPEIHDWMFSHTLAVPEPEVSLGTFCLAAISLLRSSARVRAAQPGGRV